MVSALDDLRAKLALVDEAPKASLQAKLDARKGQPGFAANVAALEAEKARLLSLTFLYRDKETKRFVTAEYALAHPDTTERVES
jgi:hypothetical protein